MGNKKWFFGWTNIKFLIVEFIKIYSHQPSFLSKKRVHEGIAFYVLQFGCIYYLIENIHTMSAMDFTIWGSAEAVLCGYQLYNVQKEKTDVKNDTGNAGQGN